MSAGNPVACASAGSTTGSVHEVPARSAELGRRRSTRHGDRQRPASPLRWSDRLIEAGALFLLVFTPLAYGTVEPWSEAIAELVVLGMVVVWIVGMLGGLGAPRGAAPRAGSRRRSSWRWSSSRRLPCRTR